MHTDANSHTKSCCFITFLTSSPFNCLYSPFNCKALSHKPSLSLSLSLSLSFLLLHIYTYNFSVPFTFSADSFSLSFSLSLSFLRHKRSSKENRKITLHLVNAELKFSIFAFQSSQFLKKLQFTNS